MKLVADEQPLTGDMAIKDLTPQTTNIGHRIVKNMRICGSGIYTYHKSEAPLLGLSPIPEKFNNLDFINVFRPAEVLVANKDKFARVPIITGHHQVVDTNNAKQLTVGMVGDTVESEVDKTDGETYLYTTGTIVAGDGIDAYENYGQLSVGYVPTMKWEEGVHNGKPYQAVLTGFNDVNHLLICKVARGGPQCMVMDSLDEMSPLERFLNKQAGGNEMSIFSKIFGSEKTQIAGDSKVVSVLLQSIAIGADPKTQVDQIRSIVGDSDETFKGYLDELSNAKGENPEVIKKAVDIVDNYYKTHFTGDEKVIEVKKDGDDKNVEVKKDGKETKDIEVKKDGDKKDVAVKEMGDEDKDKAAGDGCGKATRDSIDYDKLATLVAEKLKPAKVAGDEAPAVDDNNTLVVGDSGTSTSGFTSDSIMEMLKGGK